MLAFGQKQNLFCWSFSIMYMKTYTSFIKDIKMIIMKTKALKKLYSKIHPNTKHSLDDILSEIIYVLKTGVSWRNLRSPIKWQTIYFHFKRFVKHNIFIRLFNYHNCYTVSLRSALEQSDSVAPRNSLHSQILYK